MVGGGGGAESGPGPVASPFAPRAREEGKGGRGAEAVSLPAGPRDHRVLGVGARLSAPLLTGAHKALAARPGPGRRREAPVPARGGDN